MKLSFPSLRRREWDVRLLSALAIALVYHGGLLVSGTFRRTYDAYVHIFFADHYSRDWFGLWEPRWYTGFTVTSYPPGSHQLVALVGRVVGLEAGFVIVQTAAVLILVAGVYRYAGLWVSRRAAGYAALLAVFATGIAETVHVFGQLPTTLALGLLLNAAPAVHRWVQEGGRRHLLEALAVLGATTAAHHVTTLFGMVFFIGPVVAAALLTAVRTPVSDESPGGPARVTRSTFRPLAIRRLRRVLPGLARAGALAVGAAAALAVVVLPYWLWSRSDPITQIPIPHSSRDSFLADLNAGLVFFVVPWGLLLPVLPALLWRGFRSPRWPYAASMGFMALLGTGGTTPIPRLLLGGAYEILTLDRFTFWASVLALPLAADLLVDFVDGRAGRLPASRRTWLLATGTALALAASILVANLAQLRTFQPDPIDPDPIAAFLDKDQHDRWRYLTLGFGDQMAWLSAQTTAETVDGNYHSARRLPELVSTPVERLEGAKFRGVPGIGSLQQFLTVPERYHLKYVFSNDTFYDPLLSLSGWHELRRLENGIVVWERADVPPLPGDSGSPAYPLYQRLMWGVIPLAALTAAGGVLLMIGLLAWAPARPRRWQWWRRVDDRLAALSRLPGGGDPIRDWHVWRQLGRRMGLHRPGRRLRRAALAAVLGVAIGGVWLAATTPTEPSAVVAGYYEDLDFRRFRSAWERLDAAQRPDFDAYVLQLSVEDGLVASYSLLDAVETSTLSRTADTAELAVELTYVTALAEYRVEDRVSLVRRGSTWAIVPEPADPTIPAEPFIRRVGVDYDSQLRRQVTTGTTAYADVLDRPEIVILSAGLVEHAGRLYVVGELVNTDVDPADLTVGSRLLSGDGEVLAAYNAGTTIAHKLLPLETTPFRIEFQGVAGATRVDDSSAGGFRPGSFTPPQHEQSVAGAEVYGKAVVTATGLDRPLVVQGLSVSADPAVRLEGELFNTGVDPVTVPHVLVTLYGADGQVAWVDELWLEEAIRPGRTGSFTLDLTPAAQLSALAVPVTTFDNGLDYPSWVGEPPADVLPLPPEFGYAGFRITVSGFAGSTS